ncbi:MAG: phosphatase PAP2-related protein [Ignavibacteriaceae bacterium]
MNWKEFLSNAKNRNEFFFSLILLAITLTGLARFVNFVENRSGSLLSDPILALFNPIDLTWITFGLIYISLVVAILTLLKNPQQFLFALQLYTFMAIVRIISMFLLPLEPPEKMLLLKDPFVEFFGSGQTLTRDLFFSGHTATLLILFLVTEKKSIKIIFFVTTIVVAVCVLIQHVHYTIDVFAAVFFTYASYKLLLHFKLGRLDR